MCSSLITERKKSCSLMVVKMILWKFPDLNFPTESKNVENAFSRNFVINYLMTVKLFSVVYSIPRRRPRYRPVFCFLMKT